MLHRKINLLLSLFSVSGIYLLAMFLFSGSGLISEYAIAIIAVCVCGTFLLGGMLAGVLAVVVVGVVSESILMLPSGTAIIASACAGLMMLHLSKLQSLSLPWKGTIMTFSAASLWSGLFELIPFLQPGNLLSGWELAWSLLKQGLTAASIWLLLLIALFGIASLFKQSRPARIV